MTFGTCVVWTCHGSGPREDSVGLRALPAYGPDEGATPVHEESGRAPEVLVCADWSVYPGRGEAYRARVSRSAITRMLRPKGGWTLSRLLQTASLETDGGAVLVGVTVPLGVPASLAAALGPAAGADFLDLLRHAGSIPGFFDTWPKPARDVWRTLLADVQGVGGRVWPFDGSLAALTATPGVVLGEIHPPAAYAIAKADENGRAGAIRLLQQADWVREHGIILGGLEAARRSENAFDALVSVATLLRAVMEGKPLDAGLTHPMEGGILGAGSPNLEVRESTPATAYARSGARRRRWDTAWRPSA